MSTESITSFITPFVSVNHLKCYLGTDYMESLGNSIHFTCSLWTSLASGSVTVRRLDYSTLTSGTVVTSGAAGTEQELYFELSQATLALLGKGKHNLRLVVLLGALEYALHDFWLTVV